MAVKNLGEPMEIRRCKDCKYPKMYRIDNCIIYDKYYMCPRCGLCDFSDSKKLNEKENRKRLKKIADEMGIANE